ncbi:hypothetical protein MUO83_02405 [Candidatus Bathyarchaeota archaeon]|nr:hypothetical protein [Candidatus Bathyarchaeota archaeon]
MSIDKIEDLKKALGEGEFAKKLSPKERRVTKAFWAATSGKTEIDANDFRHSKVGKKIRNVGQYFATLAGLGLIEHVGYTRGDTPQAKMGEMRTWKWTDKARKLLADEP